MSLRPSTIPMVALLTGVGFVTKGFVMPEIVREISEAVDNTRRD